MSLNRSVGQTVSICINWQAVLINDSFSDLNTISLSSSLTITNQSIGAASSSKGFENVDGLLGLGPTDLTYGTLTDQPNSKIPTDGDNLLSQCKISSEVVGISFNPTTSLSSGNGEITVGGVDPSKYTGSLTYTPISLTSEVLLKHQPIYHVRVIGSDHPRKDSRNRRHGHDTHAHCKRCFQRIPEPRWRNDEWYDGPP